MSLAGAFLGGSVLPVFFKCMVFQIMPPAGPVEGLKMVVADRGFEFEPRMAKMLEVERAKGTWVIDRWEIVEPRTDGGEFHAFFMPSEKDDHRFALDWRSRAAADENGDRLIRTSGIADCRVDQPTMEGGAR